MNSSPEVTRKITLVRELLEKEKVDGLRLRGVDWFAWATGGGDSCVIFSAEAGVAEVLITAEHAFVLTNTIERSRMIAEQVPPNFEIVGVPWAEKNGLDHYASKFAKRVMSDRPVGNEMELTLPFQTAKWTLMPEEVARYRKLGEDAAKVMSEVLTEANPEMTEWELAGAAANACWARGIHPLLTLVGGEKRSILYRHPVAYRTPIENHAMLVICGRRHGLIANLTRHVFFRKPTAMEEKLALDVAEIEAEAFRATAELADSPEVYERLRAKYSELGYAKDIELHHQGGPCGYLSREAVAMPGLTGLPAPAVNRAFAWNPSLSGGAKIEDTIFLNEKREIEILTVDPSWPTIQIAGQKRPDILRC